MRLTAFMSESYGADVDKWWEAIVGEPPEAKTEKVRESVRTLEGHLGNAKLILNSALDRVDWLLGVDIDVTQDFQETPNIGLYTDVLQLFSSKVSPWLLSCPPITRLVWGAILVQPTADRINGYRTLQKYVPALTVDALNSSDLLYQINRSRKSNVIPDLTINRLQKWSVSQLQHFSIKMVAGPTATRSQGTMTPGFSACRVELDINSAADRSEPLPTDRLESLYEELVSLGKEIAAQGDIA